MEKNSGELGKAIDLRKYKRKPAKQKPAIGPGEIACPRCQAPVFRNARRCENCGVHFNGRAEDVVVTPRHSLLFKLVFGVVLISLVVGALTLG